MSECWGGMNVLYVGSFSCVWGVRGGVIDPMTLKSCLLKESPTPCPVGEKVVENSGDSLSTVLLFFLFVCFFKCIIY